MLFLGNRKESIHSFLPPWVLIPLHEFTKSSHFCFRLLESEELFVAEVEGEFQEEEKYDHTTLYTSSVGEKFKKHLKLFSRLGQLEIFERAYSIFTPQKAFSRSSSSLHRSQ